MTTNDNNWSALINISVMPMYLTEQSNPEEGEFVFAYTVQIENFSDETVQLLYRHWVITDANNFVREVEGEGVVGQQPYIEPGNHYRYSSGAVMSTKTGSMEGSYTMRSESGEQFDVPIPLFGLIHPDSLQ